MKILKSIFTIVIPSSLIIILILNYLSENSQFHFYSSITKTTLHNKIIPKPLEKEISIALSHYPELKATPIYFKFKEDIKKSTMQAQPVFKTLLRSKSKREYNILISQIFKVGDAKLLTKDLPSDVLIGWIGHELGHIMDFESMSNFELMSFGVRYLFSETSIKQAERAADSYAVTHGMRKYILRTKDYILNNADISEKYKARIKRLYLSPEEVMEIVTDKD